MVFVKFTSPGLSRPTRSSAALPLTMVRSAVAATSLVVVSNTGRVTTAWYFAARFWKSRSGSAAQQAFGFMEEQPAVSVAANAARGMNFQNIIAQATGNGGTFKRNSRCGRRFQFLARTIGAFAAQTGCWNCGSNPKSKVELGSTRVPRVGSGVTPELASGDSMRLQTLQKSVEHSFRRDAENHRTEARAPQNTCAHPFPTSEFGLNLPTPSPSLVTNCGDMLFRDPWVDYAEPRIQNVGICVIGI